MSDRVEKFKVVQTKDSLYIRFSSCMEKIDRACKIASQYLQANVVGIEDHLFSVNLVMREGLTNAVRHGNGNDPAKYVGFLLKIMDSSSVRIEIEDQGNGFDWKRKGLFKLPETEDHGRGIFIMGEYFTRYYYNEKGNILYLLKDF